LFIWSVFLGAAVCFRSNSHLSVDLFTLPEGGLADRVHRLVIFAINAVFVASFCYYGYFVLVSGFNRSTAILGLPLFYGWLAPWVMAVSAAFFIIEEYVAPGHVSEDVTPPGAA
jgi:TRAP-type C4-dicarboxylate transport system permease small subunit